MAAASVHPTDAARFGLLRAPRVTAAELPSGRRLWACDLAPAGGGPCAAAGPQVGADAEGVTPEDLVARLTAEVPAKEGRGVADPQAGALRKE